MTKRFIRFNELREKKVNASRSTIWRWERAGIFPARRRLGKNSVGWLEHEIDEWINSRTIVDQTAKSTQV